MFPHHTPANECCQLAGHAASRVVPGTFQDHRDTDRGDKTARIIPFVDRSGRRSLAARRTASRAPCWTLRVPRKLLRSVAVKPGTQR